MAERGGEREESSPVVSFFRTFSPLFGFLLVLTVSVLEIFRPATVNVTWEVVTLLGFVLITPYLDEIKRIWIPNVGGVDFQRDIDDAERRVEELLAGLGDGDDGTAERREVEEGFEARDVTDGREVVDDSRSDPDKIGRDTYYLLDRSPRAALAKLRMETEEAITRYLALRGYDVDRTTPMQELYNLIQKDDELGTDFFDTYRKVRELCNRAIHGEEVKTGDAADIIQIGVGLIRYLDRKGRSETMRD